MNKQRVDEIRARTEEARYIHGSDGKDENNCPTCVVLNAIPDLLSYIEKLERVVEAVKSHTHYKDDASIADMKLALSSLDAPAKEGKADTYTQGGK